MKTELKNKYQILKLANRKYSVMLSNFNLGHNHILERTFAIIVKICLSHTKSITHAKLPKLNSEKSAQYLEFWPFIVRSNILSNLRPVSKI